MPEHKGLYDKFTVIRNSTGETVEEFTFTLLPDSDPAAKAALLKYAYEAQARGFDEIADAIFARYPDEAT